LRRFLQDFSRAVFGAGGSVYLVGGFLRNTVERRKPGDVDLMVTGLSYVRTGDVLRSLPYRELGIRKVVAAGRHFPAHRVAVDWGKEYIDISNARAESETRNPGASPPIARPRHPWSPADEDREAIEDAGRRDFTINALLFRLSPGRTVEGGRLLDPFGGIEDIRRKRIRCVGEAEERLREDPIRILRSIRLKNEREGFVLHPGTTSAIRRLGPLLLPSASPDRLSVELVRSLSRNPAGTIEDLHRLGLLNVLLPEMYPHGQKNVERIARRYRFLQRSLRAPVPVPLLLGNLLADLPSDAAAVTARRLRLPDLRAISSTLECLRVLTHPEGLRFPRAETEAALLASKDPKGSMSFYRAVQHSRNRPAKNLTRFLTKCRTTPWLLTGILFKNSGIPAGKKRKEILLRIREETLAGKLRNHLDAVRLAESMQ
jgi:tRNA nucleotidyltransferase/poly(A) polymerase